MPKHYWEEAVLTVAHLINKLPSRALRNKILVSVLTQFYQEFKKSNQLPPRLFGYVSYVPIHTHCGKLYPRALKPVFLGYSTTREGYKSEGNKCSHPKSKKIFVKIDVTFTENQSFFEE